MGVEDPLAVPLLDRLDAGVSADLSVVLGAAGRRCRWRTVGTAGRTPCRARSRSPTHGRGRDRSRRSTGPRRRLPAGDTRSPRTSAPWARRTIPCGWRWCRSRAPRPPVGPSRAAAGSPPPTRPGWWRRTAGRSSGSASPRARWGSSGTRSRPRRHRRSTGCRRTPRAPRRTPPRRSSRHPGHRTTPAPGQAGRRRPRVWCLLRRQPLRGLRISGYPTAFANCLDLLGVVGRGRRGRRHTCGT
jgi:hypothetical protein